MTRQPCVYRVYDADGRLLYIGSTVNFLSRLSNHRTTSWWSSMATRYGVEVHQDIEKARRAEMEAIHREAPAFNQTYNRGIEEPLPLADGDLQHARAWLARGNGAYLPYPLRWIRESA